MKGQLGIFKNKKFVNLWVSQLLSQLTLNILSYLILVHLFELTGSSIATSMLWIAYTVPALLVGPFAATFVDWTEKRKILMISNLLQAVTVFFYAIFESTGKIFLPYAVVFAYSLLNQFYVPAEAAELPKIVSKKDLPNANGIFFITQQTSLVVGFGLASILQSIFGFKLTLLLCGLGIFVAFVSVSFLPREKVVQKLAKSLSKQFAIFFDQILEGYKFIKNNDNVLSPFILLVMLQIVLSMIVVSLPLLGTKIANVGAGSSGIIIVAPAGVGAIIGTNIVGKLLNNKWRKKRVIEIALTLMAINFVGFTLIPYTSFLRPLLTALLAFLTGIFLVGALIPSLTSLQEQTPGGFLGRVFGNFWFITTIATIIPVFFSGTITEVLGVNALLLLLSLTCVAMLCLSKFNERILKYV